MKREATTPGHNKPTATKQVEHKQPVGARQPATVNNTPAIKKIDPIPSRSSPSTGNPPGGPKPAGPIGSADAAKKIDAGRGQRLEALKQPGKGPTTTPTFTPLQTFKPAIATPSRTTANPKPLLASPSNPAAQRIMQARQQRINAAGAVGKSPQGVTPLSPTGRQAKLPVAKPLSTTPAATNGFVPVPLSSLGSNNAAQGTYAKAIIPKVPPAQLAPGGGVRADSVMSRKAFSTLGTIKPILPPKPIAPGTYNGKQVISPTQNPGLYKQWYGIMPPWATKAKMAYFWGGALSLVVISAIPSGGYEVYYEEPSPAYKTYYESGGGDVVFYPPDEAGSGGGSVAASTYTPPPPSSPPAVSPAAGGGGAAPAVSPAASSPAASPSAAAGGSGSGAAASSGSGPSSTSAANGNTSASSTATIGDVGGSAFEACVDRSRGLDRVDDRASADKPRAGDVQAGAVGAPAQLVLETGGHLAQIRSMVFTPGNRCLISAGDDKTIRIWSLATGRSDRVLRGEIEVGAKGVVNALAISPDGHLLAAGGSMDVPGEGGHAIRLYDLQSGEISGLMIGHTDAVRALAFSDDGRWLISGGADKQAIIWDVEARAPVQLLPGHGDAVIGVAFTGGGQRAVTASQDGSARLWTIADGTQVATMEGNQSPLVALAMAGDDILTARLDGVLNLWRGTNGELIRNLGKVDFVPGAVLVDKGARRAVLTCGERCRRSFEQRVISLTDGKVQRSYSGHDGFVVAAALSNDGLVATGGGTGHEIHLWRLGEAETVQVLKGHGRTISATGFYPDNRTLAWSFAFSERSHQVRGPMQFSIDLPYESIRLGAPTPVDADAAATFIHAEAQADDLSLEHGDARGGGKAAGGAGAGPSAATLRLKRSGQMIATVDPADRLGATFAYRAYGFLPSHTYFAAAGDDGVLEAYDLNGAVAMSYVGHTSTVWSLTPSSDGRLLVSGGADQTVRLWNMSTGELIVSLFQSGDGEWVMWTPQGYYTGSPSGGALVGWHVNRGDGQAAEFVSNQQLRQYLNRPDIVERAILSASAASAVQELAPNHVDLEHLFREGRPPMLVSLDGDDEATGGRGVVIVGVRHSDVPSETFDVWVRDRKVTATKVDLPAKFTAKPDVDYTALEIPLYSNGNEVRVVASNEIGSSDASARGLVIRIQHNGEGVLDKRGTLHVLAIGVDRYPQLKRCAAASCDLQFASKDAEAFAATVENVMKAGHERVAARVLVSGAGPDREPTHANIAAALAELKLNVGDNDTVALLFAGHGDNADGNYYFLPTDAEEGERGGPGANFLPWTEVQQTVLPLSGRKILFLDACRSGDSYYAQLGEDARVSRFVAYTASKGSQLAEEDPELKHGLFTYAVVNGLNGKAEDKNARAVLVFGLANYVAQEVQTRTKGRQTPELFTTPGEGNFPIVKY